MLFARALYKVPMKLTLLRLAHRAGLTRAVPPLARAYARQAVPHAARKAAVIALPVVAAGMVAGLAMRRRPAA